MEQFYIFFLLCKHWCWSRICTFSNSLYPLFISHFSFFGKLLKNLENTHLYLSFVNNGLFISQNKSISHSNANLFDSYNVISSLLMRCGLVVEHEKTNVFHFSRSQGVFNPSPLDLSVLGGPILLPKNTWQYLGFIFDQKLTFRSHINFYANKVISTVKYMKMLSYASSPVWKQCPRGETTSEPYKPTFYSGHLFCNMSYDGAATLRIFHLPWQKYSYSTQSSMMELLLSVSQHWNLHLEQ